MAENWTPCCGGNGSLLCDRCFGVALECSYCDGTGRELCQVCEEKKEKARGEFPNPAEVATP